MNKKIQSLKNKLLPIEGILVGTIQKVSKTCGKTNCRCMKDKRYWHGPYYIWTRKVKGKTVTKTLTKEQADFCRKSIKNMKQLKRIIDKWKNFSVDKIQKIK